MAALVRAEIKTAARGQLKGKWGFLLLAFIVYAIIMGAAGCTVIGALLVGGPLTIGLVGMLLMLARGEGPTFNNLFDGFKSFKSGFIAYILVGILTALWSLLLIVPGIIASIRYSQTFFILKDNPDMDGYAAIQKSKEMMQGHKGEYFVLGLSFILWALLGTITLGIAFIWIGPYMSLTYANYYEWLKRQAA
jgi:uncharacterized membrane protein